MDINQIKLDNKFKLIEASAGTGKSFTLAHIVLRNVLEKKIKPDEILLLSFTKNTCSELRDKILSRFKNLKLYLQNYNENKIDNTLKDWYLKFKEKEKSKDKIISEIDNFVNEFYKLQVTTFHAFCNYIIDEYSIEIGLTQDPYIENNIDNLYKDVIDNLWIEDFLTLHPQIISAVTKKKISSRFGSSINKSFFVEILKSIDQENICKFQINNKYKIIDLNSYFKEFLYFNWNEFCVEWNKKGKELFLNLIELGKLIKDCGGKSQIYAPKPRNNKFNQIIFWIEEINKSLDSKNVIDFLYDISNDDLLFKYFYKENISKEINKHNLKLDFTKFNSLQHKIYKIKEGLYTEFVRIFTQLAYIKLIELKKSLSIFNFNDLIKTVENKFLDSEITNNSTQSKIQKRFKCVLVDEFQDTDNTQWNLIKKFFNTNNHFLLCVGDPKQAIYKFRGGDIETYLDARSNAIEVFSLTDNYRSSKKLMDVINKLYKNGLKQSKLNYRKLTSRINENINSEFKFKNVFEIVEFSKKETDVDDIVTNYIVNFILNNKEIDINKIAILTLNNSQCLDLKNKLNQFNLPCKIQNKQNIFDTEASSLLFLFIDCLLNPRLFKNITLLAASKFIEIELEELLDDGISNNLEILINKCITWSQELREKGFLNIVNELLINYKSSSIIQDSDLNSNLFQLAEIVEIELINNDFNINKVFNWYKNQLDHSLRICTGEDFLTKDYNLQNGINLCTIHSSKGLEFDMVLCPYLSIISNNSNKIKGPIWKSNIDRNIYINISNNYSKVEKFKLIEEEDLFKESERLIYVALTRSKYKLIVFNDLEDTNNILNNDLFNNLENINIYKSTFENMIEKEKIKEFLPKFQTNRLNNNLWKIDNVNKKISKEFNSDKFISYSSYSSWIRKDKNIDEVINQYKDYEDNISIIKDSNFNKSKNFPNYFSYPNPLSEFPRGTIAGTCLHKIIERFEFRNDNNQELIDLIIEELIFHQIDSSLAFKVKDAILRIINISLGSELQNTKLVDISNQYLLKEVKYDLTLSYEGRNINSHDISKCFLLDPEYEFGEEYSNKINDLQIMNKGFHSGCIDCVFPVGNTLEDSKWWVIDWKSNLISGSDNNDCLPINYNYENMRDEMIKHHYPLQSHLYLLALHRLLKWRLKNYQPHQHLGGYIYLFLKGLPDFELFEKSNSKDISPGVFISNAPLKRINYLDNLF
ncbi:UvrD-helicase domain-containing protein [Prochlorococcus marinus]|uniref:UvrD-helicase domain-containing protein n=1 Tax=Prochlorococcus marinus TaxID=1219 RepID=UPI001ADAA3DC|nr:UvrD-helicase domain-containing protein [Prochlorococcus marinus]MBO8204731.1 UvrD-helicase domain-containing protein [Prochlorococcus marinus CUG1415]MBW3044020.1 DNA helicase UvrD [Prochlorococcus marinus str. MU1415]